MSSFLKSNLKTVHVLLGLTIAAKFTITIVIDSQKYYHDRLSIVDFTIPIVYILYIFNQLIKQFMLIPVINR